MHLRQFFHLCWLLPTAVKAELQSLHDNVPSAGMTAKQMYDLVDRYHTYFYTSLNFLMIMACIIAIFAERKKRNAWVYFSMYFIIFIIALLLTDFYFPNIYYSIFFKLAFNEPL